jgi:hypothetical protein
VLAALANAFRQKALLAVEADLSTPRGRPALPEYGSIFRRG